MNTIVRIPLKEKQPLGLVERGVVVPTEKRKLAVVELFAGIGGFRVACEELGLPVVWANDIDKRAVSVYKDNYGEDSIHVGDINEYRDIVPPHDILTAGFPCQPFSKAGKKQGVEDYRGTLFESIVYVVQRNKPTYFLLENVRNLLSLDGGRHFKTILTALSGLGYKIEWKILNACAFGLPQHRERLLILGSKIAKETETYFMTQREEDALSRDLLADVVNKRGWKEISSISTILPGWGMACDGRFVACALPVFPSKNTKKLSDVTECDVDGAFDFTEETRQRIKSSTPVERYFNGVEILYNQSGGARMGYTIFGTNGLAPTLTASSSRHYERYLIGGRFRRLTNVEYARIQGFRDAHCAAVSIYAQYKLFGNALPPPMAKWGLERIVKGLKREITNPGGFIDLEGLV